MSKELDNDLINIKKGKKRGWPFNDPNYRPRVYFEEVKKTREDGTVVIRQKTRHNGSIHKPLPNNHPAWYMNGGGGGSPTIHHLRTSPMSKGRKKVLPNGEIRVIKKWIRPKYKHVFTATAVALIKDGLMKSIVNPVSHKILAGYLKIVKIFPPVPQVITKEV